MYRPLLDCSYTQGGFLSDRRYEQTFLTRLLKEDFDLGGIPLRIVQRTVPRRGDGKPVAKKNAQAAGKPRDRTMTNKRSTAAAVDIVAAE